MILAFDVSNSMRAEDLEPTRMEAAKAAARAFVERQPDSIEIGVVAFSDGGLVTQHPTDRQGRRAGGHRPALARWAARRSARASSPSLNAIAGEPIAVDPAALSAADLESLDIGYSARRHRAAVRRREHRRPGSARRRRAGVGGRRAHLPDRRSAAAEGTVVDIDGFSVATALDEAVLTEIAERHRRDVLPGRGRDVARRGLRQHRPAPHDRGRAHRGDGGRRPASASCCCCSVPRCRCVWFGRLV